MAQCAEGLVVAVVVVVVMVASIALGTVALRPLSRLGPEDKSE